MNQYLANMALTRRRRQSRSMLNTPYDFKSGGNESRAISAGMVAMTSKANHVLRYLEAMSFGSSTSRYVVLSRQATKKVRTMSMAKKPFTTLSTMERGSDGSLRNPNSKGQTNAVQKTNNTRNVFHNLHHPNEA